MNPPRDFLKCVENREDAKVDIVAVHGLNLFNEDDHGEKTWRAPKNGKSWLREFLPSDIPEARIFLYGYNSNVAFSTGIAGVNDRANDLFVKLDDFRYDDANTRDRPIIFISHSLGGLIVKRAMTLGNINKKFLSMRKATYGLVFFGTPHLGGNYARLGKILASLARKATRNPGNDYINTLTKDSPRAQALRSDFVLAQEDFVVLTVFETLPMPKIGIVVNKESAILGLAGLREEILSLEADHSNICKFESKDGDSYKPVSMKIKRMVDAAIEARQNQPTKGSLTFPNSDLTNKISLNFVTRTKLKDDLNNLLTPDTEDQDGPKVVLVHGHAGFGKTQLVRDYARTSLHDGVAFRWLDASSVETLKASLLKFAQEAGIFDQQSISGTHGHDLFGSRGPDEIQKLLKFVGGLQRKWLLVYDNYDVPDDEIAFDLRSHFPGGQQGRIIVTSRNQAVATDIGASCLPVRSLNTSESTELLRRCARLSDMDAPSSARELANDIAGRLLGGLPLAIAQAGAYIYNKTPSTSEPSSRLEQYRRQFARHEKQLLEGDKATLVKEYGASVITSWDLSFQTIVKQNPVAAELLLLFGFMHHVEIPQTLFAIAHDPSGLEIFFPLMGGVAPWLRSVLASDENGQWDPAELENCIGLLEGYSLIETTIESNYNIHPLVHSWTRIGNPYPSSSIGIRAMTAISLVLLSISKLPGDPYLRNFRHFLKMETHLKRSFNLTRSYSPLSELHDLPKIEATIEDLQGLLAKGIRLMQRLCKLMQSAIWIQKNVLEFQRTHGAIQPSEMNEKTAYLTALSAEIEKRMRMDTRDLDGFLSGFTSLRRSLSEWVLNLEQPADFEVYGKIKEILHTLDSILAELEKDFEWLGR